MGADTVVNTVFCMEADAVTESEEAPSFRRFD